MEKDIKTLTEVKPLNIQAVTSCEATAQMLRKAERDGVETAFHRADSMKACPIGADSACCKHCAMGPCRLSSKDPYGKVGVCGATIDTIMSRNFARMVASGTASHTDHGLSMLEVFREVVNGKITDYGIKDPLQTGGGGPRTGHRNGRPGDHGHRQRSLPGAEADLRPGRGGDPLRETGPGKDPGNLAQTGDRAPGGHAGDDGADDPHPHGVDQHYENITKQCSRTALADGWGGSMVATEISDILFGTPTPVKAEVNMGVLKEDEVNIIIHGHEPNLFESILASVSDPALLEEARAAGAKGINLVGMCCSGAEMLGRHGIPHAGNFMSTEAVLVTGAVDAMGVDIQCIKQGLAKVAQCYGTRLFTTNPRCRIEGADHLLLRSTNPGSAPIPLCAWPSNRFKNRKLPIEIPRFKSIGVHGFSHEYINYMLGGTFRASYRPLNDNIINGRIRGVAGVVGCTNPRVKQDWVHVELVKELIKNDILVVQTGCSQMALAKAGLYLPGKRPSGRPRVCGRCARRWACPRF